MKTEDLPKLGATGEFPDGQISKDDEGELKFAIGSDPDNRLVFVNFSKPLAWLALGPEDAAKFAARLLAHVDRIEALSAPKR